MISDRDNSTPRAARELHADESGAITVAALAALVILLMVGLTIWDAGRSARDKIDLQTAADTAAYSQAAVQAKTMNMVAFTNVAKRSAVGMHSMYIGMWSAYVLWWEDRCKLARQAFSAPARVDCRRNRPLILKEGRRGGDWFHFSANEHYRIYGGPRPAGIALASELFSSQGGRLQTAFGNEIMALDDYQRYMTEITPWWAWAEGLVRGTRNGASATASFPTPGDFSSDPGDGWIRQALSSSSSPYGFQQNVLSNQAARSVHSFEVDRPGQTPPGPPLLRQRRLSFESCIPPAATNATNFTPNQLPPPPPNVGPVTQPMLEEFRRNFEAHRNVSEIDADEPQSVLPLGLRIAVGWGSPALSDPSVSNLGNISNETALQREFFLPGGCFWPIALFTEPVRTDPGSIRSFAVPYELAADDDDPEDLMARSNIVFSYKHTPNRKMTIVGGQVRGEGRETTKRNFFGQFGYGVDHPDSVTYATSGYWSMARSEIAFPHRDRSFNPDDPQFGTHGLWMWEPGWTARMRPLALPGEWSGLPYDLNGAFHATDRYFALAEEMGLLRNLDVTDPQPFFRDFQFMEKATRTLDDDAIEGAPK